jgi:hypothetical protein
VFGCEGRTIVFATAIKDLFTLLPYLLFLKIGLLLKKFISDFKFTGLV